MEIMAVNALIYITFLVFITSPTSIFGNSEESLIVRAARKERSLKDVIPKNGEFPQSQSRTIVDMHRKVVSLESSMNSVVHKVEHFSKQNGEFEKSLSDQRKVLQKLDLEFAAVENMLSSHGDVLNEMEKLANEDDTRVAFSKTCGGVLVGQAGTIAFSSSSLRGKRPSSCVWTIRANNRAHIKILTHQIKTSWYGSGWSSSGSSYPNSTFVVEISKTNSSSMLQTKLTNLQQNMHYIFNGPYIFLVTLLLPWAPNLPSVELHLRFEGAGQRVEKNAFFTHESLFQNSGNFSNSELSTWSPSVLEQLDDTTNYTLDYTTIVVSNFSTKVYLQVTLEKGCSNSESFLVITDLMQRNTSIIDCCKTKCEGRNALINFEDPFLIIITKKFQQPLPFSITWVAEKSYQSSSSASYFYYDPCGDVVGGTKGSISYKRYRRYLENERCIWTIVSQPRPRSIININVSTNGINDMNDHLYMMELTDVYGNELHDAPRITSLRQANYGYKARSREVYIVFYSDPYPYQGSGFSLTWELQGDIVKTRTDVSTKFTIYKSQQGSATSTSMNPIFTAGTIYQVFIFTPVVPTSTNYGTQICLNQTTPIPGGNDCFHNDLKVFTSRDGIFTKDKINCSESGEALINASDGMAVVVLNMPDPSLKISMNFKWKEGFGKVNRRTDSITVEDNICGGVIIGDEGVLKYKMNKQYWNNELCVWLLHAPNSRGMTVTLANNGFESCCDYLFVNTINPQTGDLNLNPSKISRDNPIRTFQEAMLVLVFFSDSSTRGTGFTLQFSGNGHIANTEYRYILRHRRASLYGSIEFPSSDLDDGLTGKNNIYVIASSPTLRSNDGPSITPVAIDWAGGAFRKQNYSNNYDKLTLYAPASYSSGGWAVEQQFPSRNDTLSLSYEDIVGTMCIVVPEKKNVFHSDYSAFLAIYKPNNDDENYENETRFRFDYYLKSSGCGGVIVEEYGYISYKEETQYTNGETCSWLVEVPQAEAIRFELEKNGLEECCDFVGILSVDANGGLNRSSMLTANATTAIVEGSVAVVIFMSDTSVTGLGFRLRFTAETQASLDPPHRYRLIHSHQQTHTRFAYEVEANEVVIVAFSPDAHRQIYDRSQLRLNVTAFRPQIDVTCQSDTLTVYNSFFLRYGESMYDVDQFTAKDVVRDQTFLRQMANHTCAPFVNSQFKPCDHLLACHDAPIRNNSITTYYDAFVAIYTSVNVTADLKFRGFVLVNDIKYDLNENTTVSDYDIKQYALNETHRMVPDYDDYDQIW